MDIFLIWFGQREALVRESKASIIGKLQWGWLTNGVGYDFEVDGGY